MSGRDHGPAPGVPFAVVLWNDLIDMGFDDPRTVRDHIRAQEAKIASLEGLLAANTVFYDLTVAQRDRAWREVEALKDELTELAEADDR